MTTITGQVTERVYLPGEEWGKMPSRLGQPVGYPAPVVTMGPSYSQLYNYPTQGFFADPRRGPTMPFTQQPQPTGQKTPDQARRELQEFELSADPLFSRQNATMWMILLAVGAGAYYYWKKG